MFALRVGEATVINRKTIGDSSSAEAMWISMRVAVVVTSFRVSGTVKWRGVVVDVVVVVVVVTVVDLNCTESVSQVCLVRGSGLLVSCGSFLLALEANQGTCVGTFLI